MTDSVNVGETTSQNQNVSSAPMQQVSGDQSAEKLLRQSEVNDLVGKAKHAAYEKGKQEALATLQPQSVNTSVMQPTVNQQPQNVSPQLTPEQEKRIADKAYQDAYQRLQTDQLVNQFALKMSDGVKKYSDFEKVVTSLQLQNIPDVVQLANGFENTADIMYDLGTNPTKVANLRVLHQINPQLAREEMQRLANSIKQNQQAIANQPDVRAPMSQVKPSNVGIDNGSKTVADLRRSQNLRA